MRMRFAIIGMLLLSACSTKAEDQLLASELTYFEQTDGWTRSIEIDPWLASRPELLRQLRADRLASMNRVGEKCGSSWGNGCAEISTFKLHHDGERLVSLMEETYFFGGGAHGTTVAADHLFDLQTGNRIRFGDIFASWARVRPLLQRAFCKELKWQRDDVDECPDIQKQALSLDSWNNDRIKLIIVSTSDYALGNYAAGRAEVDIPITPAIYALIKPEYRQEVVDPASDTDSDYYAW